MRKHRDEDELNIDGRPRKWGEFTKKFHEDIDRKKKQGQEVREKSFVLNLNNPRKEKLLTWHYQMGFFSENSDDENVKYNRVERQYLRSLTQQHGEKVFLQRREIRPFERMMLKLGGA